MKSAVIKKAASPTAASNTVNSTVQNSAVEPPSPTMNAIDWPTATPPLQSLEETPDQIILLKEWAELPLCLSWLYITLLKKANEACRKHL